MHRQEKENELYNSTRRRLAQYVSLCLRQLIPLNTAHLELTTNPLLRAGKLVIDANLGLSLIAYFTTSKMFTVTVTAQ